MTEPENWVKEIRINLDDCKGCKTCVNACFADVLCWDDVNEKPIAAYPEDCVWCLACEAGCSAQCIEVVPNIPAPLRSSF
jgi:NAD-dependent dihydropyrimidine dehydrogenase PreA subunit